MTTHKVVVDLIAKASGNGFKDAANDAQALENKVKGTGAATTGVMARIGGNGKAMGLAVAAGALAGGVALARFASTSVNAFISTTDAVRGFQRVAGGTAEDASRLTFALQRVGIAPETAARGFGMLSAKLGQGKVDLSQYGVEIKKNKDGSVNMTDAVLQLSDALGGMNTNAKNAALKDLFGKGGQQLLPLLGKTREELTAIFALAGKDHQIFSQSDLDQAKNYKAALAEMNLAWQGMQVQVGQAVLPVLQTLTEDVFTPLAQLVADNADAFAVLAEVIGAVAVPALAALVAIKFGSFLVSGYTAIAGFGSAILDMAGNLAVGTIAMEGFAASEEAAAVAGSELAAGAGLGAILGIAAPVALAAGAVWGLAYAVGYFDNEQSKVQKNSGSWAQNIVVQSQKATGSLDQAKAKYAELGRQIKGLGSVVGQTFSDNNRARIERGLSPRTIQQFNTEMGKTKGQLGDAKSRYEALGNAIETFGGSLTKTVPATNAQKEAASVLGTAIQESAGKADTFAAAQENLQQALIASSQATNSDKDAKKQLEDAINRVTTAQDRMNNALMSSVDDHIATAQAEQQLIAAIGEHADALTIAQDASTVAKARVKEYNDTLIASGQAPLTVAQQTQMYIDQLKILAASSPETAAALNPLITNLTNTQNAAINAATGVDTMHARLKELAGRYDVTVVVSGQSYNVPWSLIKRNKDGSPDLDGNPATPMWTGGQAKAGHLYQINEKGQELFMPATNGRIMNARESAARLNGSGSGGDTYNITVQSLVPTAQTGKLILEHLRKAKRDGGADTSFLN